MNKKYLFTACISLMAICSYSLSIAATDKVIHSQKIEQSKGAVQKFEKYMISLPSTWSESALYPAFPEAFSYFYQKCTVKHWSTAKNDAACAIYSTEYNYTTGLGKCFKSIIRYFYTEVDQMKGFKVLEKGTTTINGVPARWFTSSFTYNGVPHYQLGYVLITNHMLYEIYFTSHQEHFPDMKKTFEESANSFIVVKQ